MTAAETGRKIAAMDGPTSPCASALTTLPAGAYSDEDGFRAEMQAIFARRWVLAGFSHDLAAPGDARPIAVAGAPVLLVRGEDGALRAFHNVCRHRAARLVAAPCAKARAIVCPYHGWTYGLDGALRAAPQWRAEDGTAPAGFDAADHGLIAVAAAEWGGMIFVRLAEDGPDFAAHIRPLAEHWAPYRLDLLRAGGEMSFEIPANWKLAVENFIDTYHLPFIHRQLGTMRQAMQVEDVTMGGDAGSGPVYGYRYPRGSAEKPKSGQPFASFPDLPAELMPGQDIVGLFPNALFELMPDYLLVFHLEPLAPNRTRERLVFFYLGEDATDPALADRRAEAAEAWRIINEQDMTILAELQAGIASPAAARPQPDPPFFDRPLSAFRQAVAKALAEN
ncbi:MAG: aromatic ring-hydroxylating dioxygenase subunit alpha [Proteobacteria bacterium]|nr:aromatic ring-hydroxylating dioxygenase subunit alpha [Pseudomonadota bacterium]